jgi:hypothetical protein
MEFQELIRKWKLEADEAKLLKLHAVELMNFEVASEYRDKEKLIRRKIEELEAVLDSIKQSGEQ